MTACDGQYDSVPANEAYTVNSPCTSGFQFKANVPSIVVALPIFAVNYCLRSIMLRVTSTPVVFVGFGFCM